MKFRVIDRCREAFPVRMMCKQLQVSPSGYYGWRDREPSKRELSNQRLLTRIKSLHEESDDAMGAPRIWDELRYQGHRCTKNRNARLMRLNEIQGIPQKQRWNKKASGSRPIGITNHLDRDFKADEANIKWVSDITYGAPSLRRLPRMILSKLEHVWNASRKTMEETDWMPALCYGRA